MYKNSILFSVMIVIPILVITMIGFSSEGLCQSETEQAVSDIKQSFSVEIELNKFESSGKDCLPLFVVRNKTQTDLTRFLIELVAFDLKGIIAKRVAFDIAPLASAKMRVIGFPFSDLTCDSIGTILLNRVRECRTELLQIPDCEHALSVSSRTQIPFYK